MIEGSGSDQKVPDLFSIVNDAYNDIFMKENMLESGFSHAHYLLSKQRSTLNIEHSNLLLKLTNLQPNIHDLLRTYQNSTFPLKNNSRIKSVFAFTINWFFSHVNCIKH